MQVIFKETAGQGSLKKYLSLFPGLGFGAGYKILQRVYKFGGQVKWGLAREYNSGISC